MIDAKTIEELQGLLAKATLGPWSTHLVDDTTIMSPAREVATTCDSSQTDREDGYDIEYEQMEADAALIVAMRNALPALLDLASKTLASAREGEDSPAGILDVQRMLTIHQPTGWLARDIAIASARLQPQVSASAGWQSIETAPRDGTRFLTWDSYYGVRMGRAFMRADHDDWLSYVDSNGSSHKGGIRASHWMPLPAVPVDGGEDA